MHATSCLVLNEKALKMREKNLNGKSINQQLMLFIFCVWCTESRKIFAAQHQHQLNLWNLFFLLTLATCHMNIIIIIIIIIISYMYVDFAKHRA